jgi:peptide/nickel transport system substrate-binding protein
MVVGRNRWMEKRLTRRRIVGAGGAGALTAALAACGRKTTPVSSGSSAGQARGPAGSPVQGGTLNVWINYNAPLDPQQTSGSVHEVVSGVYSRIFKFKTTSDPQVSLDHVVENDLGLQAETPDGMTWTVKLRPDAKFTNAAPVNGHPLEAEDVKATFTRAVDPATSNPNAGQLSMIDPSQIHTPDPTTVVFKLKYPYAPFNRTLASPNYSLILPRESLSGSYDLMKVAIGSGPFTLESAVPDVAYDYKRNPGYYDKSLPNVDAMHIAVIADTSQQLAQFTAGNLDEHLLDSPFTLDQARKSNPKASLVQFPYGTTWAVYMQMNDPASVFKDVRVRRALNMAIDRDTLGKAIYLDEAQTCWLIPSYMGKWSMQTKDLPPDIRQYYTYNPAESKKLLDAAGVSGQQFKLVYQNREGTPAFVKEIETVSSMLSSVGIKTNVISVDYTKDWIAGGKGINAGFFPKDTLVFSGISSFTEADEFLYLTMHSKSTQSHMTVKDPDMDAKIDQERTTLNDDERLKAVRDIITYAAGQAYYVPVVGDGVTDTLIKPRVKNYLPANSVAGKVPEMYAKLWLES